MISSNFGSPICIKLQNKLKACFFLIIICFLTNSKDLYAIKYYTNIMCRSSRLCIVFTLESNHRPRAYLHLNATSFLKTLSKRQAF